MCAVALEYFPFCFLTSKRELLYPARKHDLKKGLLKYLFVCFKTILRWGIRKRIDPRWCCGGLSAHTKCSHSKCSRWRRLGRYDAHSISWSSLSDDVWGRSAREGFNKIVYTLLARIRPECSFRTKTA